jgi:hypothetical protein
MSGEPPKTFDTYDRDYANAQIDARGKRIKADSEPTQENLDAATAADERRASICREFRKWCLSRRDDIHPDGDLAPAEWQTLHDQIVARLQTLEADCPPGEDPQPDSKKAGRKPLIDIIGSGS